MKQGVPTVCLPDLKPLPCVRPFPDHRNVNAGGPHHGTDAVVDINNGHMDGFALRARIAAHTCVDSVNPECAGPRRRGGPPDAMGYHTGTDLPNYWTYANDFVLLDHMFEPDSSWSLPAHLFMVSAWSAKMHTSQRPVLVRQRQCPVIQKRPRDRPSTTTHEPRTDLRLDRPDVHVARSRRVVRLLRRRRHPTRLRKRRGHLRAGRARSPNPWDLEPPAVLRHRQQ